MSGPTPSIQLGWDGPGLLGAGSDGKALCWDQATGKFTPVAKADAEHTHAPADLTQGGAAPGQALVWSGTAWAPGSAGVTDHGALAGLADDDHAIYALADGSRGSFAALGHTHAYNTLTGLPTLVTAHNQLTGLGADDHANYIFLTPAASTRNVIQPASATIKPLIVRGFASQSANIQEWQNSASSVVASVGPTGALSITGTMAGLSSSGLRMSLANGGNFDIRDGSSQTLYQCTHGTGTHIFRQFSASAVAVTIRGHTGQTANLLDVVDNTPTVQFAIGATGKILTNQSVANTNTPSGATARAQPIYDIAGTLLGFIPVYAAQW